MGGKGNSSPSKGSTTTAPSGEGKAAIAGATVSCYDMPGITNKRFQGTIKTFNIQNGFGFISSPELAAAFGEQVDAFLHRDEIGSHEVGTNVTFAVILSKEGRPRAK